VQRFLSQPFTVAEVFTGMKGQFVPLEESIDNCKRLVAGEFDDVPEPAFLLKGNMDTVLAAAKQMAADFAEQQGKSVEKDDEEEAAASGPSLMERRISALYKFYDERDAELDAERNLFNEMKKKGELPADANWDKFDEQKRSKWTGAIENGKIKPPPREELEQLLG